MSQKLLRMECINKRFPGTHALKDVDFDLNIGEIHGLIGENGAGKSTLIKIIAGYHTKDSGKIILDGKEVDILSPRDSLELGIRVISQEFNLMDNMTVAENIANGDYPVKGKSIILDRKKMENKAAKLLDLIGCGINIKSKVGSLTVAEKQMVEIAKSLWRTPRLLIMDEPTAALNNQETNKLFNVLKTLKAQNVSIVFITHRLEEQFEISDRVTVLRNGKYIATLDPAVTTTDKMIETMIGKNIGANYIKKKDSNIGDIVYELENVSFNHSLKNLNFNIKEGEIVSVYGLLGQGQNELGSILIGNQKISSGTIRFQKEILNLSSPKVAREVGIGYVSDDRKSKGLFSLQSVKNNISVSALPLMSRFSLINSKKESKEVKKWINRLKVVCSSQKQIISSLSGGNQQKAMIARWLANQSKFLILNLPTRGVDIGAKFDIYELLEELCELGVACLVISLELPEVLGISDRVYIMKNGTFVAEFEGDQINDENLSRAAVGDLKGA